MTSNDRILKKLHTAFKLSGFTLRRDYCLLIIDTLTAESVNINEKSIFDDIIKRFCKSFENQCLSEHSLERTHVEQAIEGYLRAGQDQNESVFSVISAFKFPRLMYNQDRKIYALDNKKPTLLADANHKALMFVERYSSILQRIRRIFANNLVGKDQNAFKLQTVDYLLTLSEVNLKNTLILGSLLQVSEGKYYLEDPTGLVQLELKHAQFQSGFFIENGFYLVNGKYEDKLLTVSSIFLPFGEEYTYSKPAFGTINYFGGVSNVPLRDSYNLKEYMENNLDNNILFFSDVWLDHPMTFEKLEKVFEGMQAAPPVAFVFMGNFMSDSTSSDLMEVQKKLFKKLADLILNYPVLVHECHFVFVPGLMDPCTPHIVPRLPLPSYITKDVTNLLPKAIFTTNPCRLQYCNREIVVFRADVVAKFLQGSLHKPAKAEIASCVTRTIIGQGHLSPLSLNALPVHWDLDFCLRLYPLPDLVVIGDRFQMYKDEYKKCVVANPGPFCEGDFQFMDYIPSQNEMGECTLE